MGLPLRPGHIPSTSVMDAPTGTLKASSDSASLVTPLAAGEALQQVEIGVRVYGCVYRLILERDCAGPLRVGGPVVFLAAPILLSALALPQLGFVTGFALLEGTQESRGSAG